MRGASDSREIRLGQDFGFGRPGQDGVRWGLELLSPSCRAVVVAEPCRKLNSFSVQFGHRADFDGGSFGGALRVLVQILSVPGERSHR